MIFLPLFFEKKCVKLFPFFLPPKVLHYYHYDLFCFCRLSPHFFLSPLLLPGNIVGKGRKRKNEEESLLINSAKAGNCRRAKKWIEPASQDVCVCVCAEKRRRKKCSMLFQSYNCHGCRNHTWMAAAAATGTRKSGASQYILVHTHTTT